LCSTRFGLSDGWEVSGALIGCSTGFGLCDGWEVSGALIGCSTGFGLSDGWEVSGALLGCSTRFGLSDGGEVPSCSSAAVVEDGSGGAVDAEVALFNAVEEVVGTRNLKPENIIELAKKPITQRRKGRFGIAAARSSGCCTDTTVRSLKNS
jgi:hypothetical protein